MAELLLSGRAVTIYEIIGIVILLLILIWQSRKKKEFRERKQIKEKELRIEQLDSVLSNPDRQAEPNKDPHPFEIQYSDGTAGDSDRKAAVRQVEIEVHTRTSIRKYLFDLDEEITIGRDERNRLPIADEEAALRCCSISFGGGAVWASCPAAGGTVSVQRGKAKIQLKQQRVKLQSKDILTAGRTAMHIMLYT